MLSYKRHICNIPDCTNPDYSNHMCKDHYDFYMKNPQVQQVAKEMEALETGVADWKLKLKWLYHTFIHLVFSIPMPLYEHFPLEHIFLTELNTIRKDKNIDIERCQQIKKDFDIPENENIAVLQRMLNVRDIETSELGPKERYLLYKKDLPSIVPIILFFVGFALLLFLINWYESPGFQIRGMTNEEIKRQYFVYIPYICAFAICIILGRSIPNHYNYLVERAYNLTLFKSLEHNVDIVNHVQYVKNNKARASSFYAVQLGFSVGIVIVVFNTISGGEPIHSWLSFFYALAISLMLIPLLYALVEMVLYYPVIEAMKRKRVAIDLYNADYRGGLKSLHFFLYKVFLFNEGVAVVLLKVFSMLPIDKAWVVLLILLLLPRFNHAGWAIMCWVRSAIDFATEKSAEKKRLMVNKGTSENLERMLFLKKIRLTGLVPLLAFLVTSILIPYIINQLPQWKELLSFLGIVKIL